MNYFKHKTDALTDPFIAELVRNFGGDGYMVYFRTLELLSKLDALDTFACITRAYFVEICKISEEKVFEVLKFSKQKGKLSYKVRKDELLLFCPNLKVIRDEYTSKKIRKMSGHTPDNVPTPNGQKPAYKEEEKEKDKEKEGEEKLSPFSDFVGFLKTEAGRKNIPIAPTHFELQDLQARYDGIGDAKMRTAWTAYITRIADQMEEYPNLKSFIKHAPTIAQKV